MQAYVKTLSAVFLIGVPASIVALGGALMMKNVTMQHDAAPAATPKDVASTASAETSTQSGHSHETAAVDSEADRKASVEDVEKQTSGTLA